MVMDGLGTGIVGSGGLLSLPGIVLLPPQRILWYAFHHSLTPPLSYIFAGTIGGLGAHGLGSAHMMGSEELQGIFSPSPRATPHTKASHQPTASTHDAHASFMQIHYNHEYQPKAQQGSSSSRTQHYADDSYTQELHDRHYTTGTHLPLCSAADALSCLLHLCT